MPPWVPTQLILAPTILVELWVTLALTVHVDPEPDWINVPAGTEPPVTVIPIVMVPVTPLTVNVVPEILPVNVAATGKLYDIV